MTNRKSLRLFTINSCLEEAMLCFLIGLHSAACSVWCKKWVRGWQLWCIFKRLRLFLTRNGAECVNRLKYIQQFIHNRATKPDKAVGALQLAQGLWCVRCASQQQANLNGELFQGWWTKTMYMLNKTWQKYKAYIYFIMILQMVNSNWLQ